MILSYHLALYDFASKQKYIYNTPKIIEISGASALLDRMYGELVDKIAKDGIKIKNTPADDFSMEEFEKSSENGEVLYDGGGNLMVLFKSKDDYKKANNAMSKYILENYPGLTMIVAGVEYTGDYNKDKSNLYAENRKRKNRFAVTDITGVTPVTQIDPLTFGPVVKKIVENKEKLTLSGDRVCKRNTFQNENLNYENYEWRYDRDYQNIDKLDENTGLLAVIYVDGNGIGKALQDLTEKLELPQDGKSNYDNGVAKQREFSQAAKEIFVMHPMEAIYAKGLPYRRILGGGDEITILCRAQDAFELINTYFNTIKNNENGFTSCAGIAVFHAGSPFTVAYEIAEECCENAKKTAKKVAAETNGKIENYFDFYYCHGGITTDFDTLRNRQSITARPYKFDDNLFDKYKDELQKAGRANVKALGNAIQQGPEHYKFEAKRINAYLKKDAFSGDEDEMKVVYDMSEFYDLWFSKKEENKDEQNSED